MNEPGREKKRFKLTPATMSLLVAIGAGMLAVLLTRGYVERQARAFGDDIEVLVASRALPAGTVLRAADLTTRRIPQKSAHLQVVEAEFGNEVLGRKTLVDMEPFQWIQWNLLEQRMVRQGMAEVLEEGRRAFTIAVDRVSAVGGFIQPNDHVDIIGTFAVPPDLKITEQKLERQEVRPGQEGSFMIQQLTKILMQDVTVLAVGSWTVDVASGGAPTRNIQNEYTDMTLLVSPIEAQILMFAQEAGKLSFMLRNKDRDKTNDTNLPAISLDNLIDLEQRITKVAAQGERFRPFGSLDD